MKREITLTVGVVVTFTRVYSRKIIGAGGSDTALIS